MKISYFCKTRLLTDFDFKMNFRMYVMWCQYFENNIK